MKIKIEKIKGVDNYSMIALALHAGVVEEGDIAIIEFDKYEINDGNIISIGKVKDSTNIDSTYYLAVDGIEKR